MSSGKWERRIMQKVLYGSGLEVWLQYSLPILGLIHVATSTWKTGKCRLVECQEEREMWLTNYQLILSSPTYACLYYHCAIFPKQNSCSQKSYFLIKTLSNLIKWVTFKFQKIVGRLKKKKNGVGNQSYQITYIKKYPI